MLRFLFLFVIFMFLLSTLLPQLDFSVLLSILCLIIVCFTFFLAKRSVQILGGAFLLLGLTLLWTSGAQWHQYILSFGPMLDLITLFTLVPILGIPIKLGGYSGGIQTIIQKKVNNSGQLYIITSGISYFFSIFMNLATLPMTYYSIRPSLNMFSVENKERFMSRAITRGFAMPLLWAPVTPIVGIVISVTDVRWISILPYVIPLSILGLGMDWFIGARRSKKMHTSVQDVSAHETAATIEQGQINSPGRILQIFLAILIFVIAISIAESLFHYSFLILVSFLVIPFALVWSLFLKKGAEFGSQLMKHFHSFSISMKDQFFIFLSAGFFISTITVSHTNEWLNDWILTFINVAGVEIFMILLPLVPLAFAFLGLHPAVSLALMTGGLDISALGLNPHILTVAMLAGAVASFLVGPYNATLGLMSNLVKDTSYKVSNWNIAFTSFYIIVVMLYLVLLQVFTG
ncbi:hypothetical protein MLOOGBEN_25445 [Bacillus sp. EB106-08-02-XG196]|uniref:hypothetical protein n=1 Tax=Bacillus sp. EB106-08-02-XG196 TaxID=2737049 RepID=UPI0015C49701|nr:hypothetical protein [Bacillus sp. EB106-08-02-XG196]NWQ44051.1 hypothetical protein [Bacillus sp. EB106-08-02-XG196]